MRLFEKLFGGAESSTQHHHAQPGAQTLAFDGDGAFHVQVVGESRYRESFECIFGPRKPDGMDEERDAKLVLDDDNEFDDHAVRVEIEGEVVGYLTRDHARAYRRWLDAQGHGRAYGQCRALIRGGWDRGEGDRGDYGIRLDLPSVIVRGRRRETRPEPKLDEHGQPNLVSTSRGESIDRCTSCLASRRASSPTDA